MKLLKNILLLTIILLVGCDNNDDTQTNPAVPADGFIHNNVFYETPNAYFEIDEDDDNPIDGFPDEYNFFFTDGRMSDADSSTGAPVVANEYIFTLNTSNFVFFNLRVVDNPSLASSAPLAGNTYKGDVYAAPNNLTPNTVIIHSFMGGVNAFIPAFYINGLEFGNPIDSYGVYELQGLGGNGTIPLLTINDININTTNPALSTIDVDYTYTNNDAELILGHYEGTLGVFED